MFPFKDDNPTRKLPVVNWLIIASCIGIYLLLRDDGSRQSLYTALGVIPANGVQLPDLVTYQFLHASGGHLIGNLVFLWIFGDNIEDCIGKLRYLMFYVLCGISAALTHSFIYADSVLPLVGASGSIAGVMGAYLIRYPRVKILFILVIIPLRLPAFVLLLFWLGRDIYGFVQYGSASQVAFSAHLGGFFAGIALFILFGGFKKRQQAVVVKAVANRRKSFDI